MNRYWDDYQKGEYLGSSEDMAHHKYDAYKVDDEIHIVYETLVNSEKIEIIKSDMDAYLWTPYVTFLKV